MNNSIGILFLGGSKRVSVGKAFIDAGNTQKNTVRIYSYELSETEPIGKTGTILKGLKWNAPDILEHLSATIKKNNINIVIPFVDVATVLCARLAERLPKVFFCAPAAGITETITNKTLANKWFTEQGISVPPTAIKAPLLAKPVKGSGGKGMLLLETEEELSFFLQFKQKKGEYFLQQFITGDEYTVDCYVERSGKIISIVPRKRVEAVNGEVVKSVTIKDSELIELTKGIIKKGNFTGPLNVQYIREKSSGKTYVMEINPRLGSGVVTSIEAGANVCRYIINEYLGIPNEYCADWKENVLMVRAFQEFYFYADNN